MMRCSLMNVDQLAELLLGDRDELPGRRVIVLGASPTPRSDPRR